MRFLIPLLALAACSQSPPQPEPASDPVHISRVTYHCSVDGNVLVRFELPDGFEEGLTGERCDYAQWRADEAVYGPVESMGRLPDYEEWLRARESGA